MEAVVVWRAAGWLEMAVVLVEPAAVRLAAAPEAEVVAMVEEKTAEVSKSRSSSHTYPRSTTLPRGTSHIYFAGSHRCLRLWCTLCSTVLAACS